jgi:hypothetical protein
LRLRIGIGTGIGIKIKLELGNVIQGRNENQGLRSKSSIKIRIKDGKPEDRD